VIGHPEGLIQKYAGGATITKSTDTYRFEANLDAFAGNSGAPVFRSAGGEVEGILTGGGGDYRRRAFKTAEEGGGAPCYVVNDVCLSGCGAEQVTRISNLAKRLN
jgi:hypothetical protein